jgi:hypothetical protein
MPFERAPRRVTEYKLLLSGSAKNVAFHGTGTGFRIAEPTFL